MDNYRCSFDYIDRVNIIGKLILKIHSSPTSALDTNLDITRLAS